MDIGFFKSNDNHFCRFNKMIDCTEQDCGKCNKCGWNPEVANKRVEEWKIEQKQKIYGCE